MNLNYNQIEVILSAARKTIGIQVYPDCSVKVRVPKWLPQNKIDEIINQKQSWINKKLQYFQQNQRSISKPKEYITGESVYYLGKEYKLNIIEAKNNAIERVGDVIFVHKTAKRNIQTMVEKWLIELAEEVFAERLLFNFEIFSKQYNYQFPTLQLKKMKSRWGSMSNNGNMILNVNLIHTTIECIDYVIMHELCHLKYRDHSKKFHQLQAKFTPNYKEIKILLNKYHS